MEELPFQIYDCRETHERDVQDIVDKFETIVKKEEIKLENVVISISLPRVCLELGEL